MIDSLVDRDRLELIEFGSSPRRWQAEAVVASRDGKRAASKWVKALRASGATEMNRAIIEALTPLRHDAQRQVVLITDGYIGFENEIVRTVLERLPSGSRLHTLGVGSSPNRSLTGPAARAGGGVEQIIGVDEDVEPAAKRLLDRTRAPLVTELVIVGAGVETAPARLPDLYAGAPVRVSFEAAAAGGTLAIRGTTADGVYEQTVTVPAAPLGGGNPGLAALFGRERIEDLETRRACGSGIGDIDGDIERLGLRYQIASRMTSWVAVDEDVTLDPGRGPGRSEQMPHEIPHGTSIAGMGLRGTMRFEQTRAGVMKSPVELQRLMQTRGMRAPAAPPAQAPGAPPPDEDWDDAAMEVDSLADMGESEWVEEQLDAELAAEHAAEPGTEAAAEPDDKPAFRREADVAREAAPPVDAMHEAAPQAEKMRSFAPQARLTIPGALKGVRPAKRERKAKVPLIWWLLLALLAALLLAAGGWLLVELVGRGASGRLDGAPHLELPATAPAPVEEGEYA